MNVVGVTETGEIMKRCETCNGSGLEVVGNFFASRQRTCERCDGQGWTRLTDRELAFHASLFAGLIEEDAQHWWEGEHGRLWIYEPVERSRVREQCAYLRRSVQVSYDAKHPGLDDSQGPARIVLTCSDAVRRGLTQGDLEVLAWHIVLDGGYGHGSSLARYRTS